jgi:uncharacterized membrane protein
MELSIFLAQIIGIYLIADGIVAITRFKELIPIIEEFKLNKILFFSLGTIVLLLGLIIVLNHNIWHGEPYQIVITLIGWIVLIKGLILFLLPSELIKSIIDQFNHPNTYRIAGTVTLLFGLWLTYHGFVI